MIYKTNEATKNTDSITKKDAHQAWQLLNQIERLRETLWNVYEYKLIQFHHGQQREEISNEKQST